MYIYIYFGLGVFYAGMHMHGSMAIGRYDHGVYAWREETCKERKKKLNQ